MRNAVMMVDFTRPLFSDDRCDLLRFAPDLSLADESGLPEKVRDGFIENIGPNATAAARELRRNLIKFADDGNAFQAALETFEEACDGAPTPKEIAEDLEIDEKQVERLMRIDQRPVSLDASVHPAGNESLGDLLEDPKTLDPVEELHQARLTREIESLLLGLSSRERDVLSWKFGLVGERGLTLQEIADRLGLSRERVRQIQVAAIRKLRARSTRVPELGSQVGSSRPSRSRGAPGSGTTSRPG